MAFSRPIFIFSEVRDIATMPEVGNPLGNLVLACGGAIRDKVVEELMAENRRHRERAAKWEAVVHLSGTSVLLVNGTPVGISDVTKHSATEPDRHEHLTMPVGNGCEPGARLRSANEKHYRGNFPWEEEEVAQVMGAIQRKECVEIIQGNERWSPGHLRQPDEEMVRGEKLELDLGEKLAERVVVDGKIWVKRLGEDADGKAGGEGEDVPGTSEPWR